MKNESCGISGVPTDRKDQAHHLAVTNRLAKEKVAGPSFTAASVNVVAAHTGQSSQLFAVTAGRNAQFLATIQIGLNVSHTDAGSLENDKIWIPLNLAA